MSLCLILYVMTSVLVIKKPQLIAFVYLHRVLYVSFSGGVDTLCASFLLLALLNSSICFN